MPHRPGRHCGSSAIRDLLEFHGTTLTEAMCFGLGSG
ncbi:MAG: BtrH N-terminal domain-containing protein, partial [Pseudomonadota bacterium]